MTQPQDPRKQPLQDDEIALARVLRALPAGEPSAAVDAAILAAATDAVAAGPGERPRSARPRRVLPWLPTWAIGTAAAAVLAVGIGVQLRPPLAPTVSPQAEQSPALRPLPEARPRMDVTLPEPSFAPPPAPPAPPPAQPAQVRSPRPTAAALPPPPPPPPAPAPEAPAPAPPAVAEAFPAAPVTDAAPAAKAESGETLDRIVVSGTRVTAPPEESGDQARRRHQAAYAERARQRAEAAEREAMAREDVERRASREASVSAGVAPQAGAASAEMAEPPAAEFPAPVAAAPLAVEPPPVSEDLGLSLDAWIGRIRWRQAAGDFDGARESLARLLAEYPDAELPADLDDLR